VFGHQIQVSKQKKMSTEESVLSSAWTVPRVSAKDEYEEFKFAAPIDGDPDWQDQRNDLLSQGGYLKSYMQRDPRTSIKVKLGYSGLGLATSLFCLVSAVGLLESYKKCETKISGEQSTAQGGSLVKVYEDVAYFGLAIALLFFALSVYALVRWKWLWMTTKLKVLPIVRVRPLGEDVEDHDPFVLGRFGLTASEDAKQAETNISLTTREAYYQLQQQHRQQLEDDFKFEQEEAQRLINSGDQ